jgi:pimeloyl-ACP methyl ester carboxylesterase
MSNVNLSETAPTQFQDIGGVSLAYRHFGKKGAPPVLCFQHFTGTMNNFDPIHTNRLAQDRPVILVDYRGVGRSGGKMPDSMPATAADIIAFVKALGLTEIDLFGFSIGGMVAQQVALDAPELVRRILLVGTGPTAGEGMQVFSPEVLDIVSRPNSTLQERCQDLFFSKSPTSYAAGRAWLERIAARKLDREPESKPHVAEAQLAALAKWGAIPATDRYGDLRKIKQRTLVVNGKNDIMVPTINSYILQQHLPDARLIVYPDSGHGSHFQFPEEFAEEAARFFAAA